MVRVKKESLTLTRGKNGLNFVEFRSCGWSGLWMWVLALLLAQVHTASISDAKVRDYKPSLTELTVAGRENPKILLANFPGQSLVLNLLNGEPSANNYFVHLARQATNSDPGFFHVEAPKDHGLMVVVQQLNLRRISDSHSLLQIVNNCKDYLMFEGYNGEKMASTNLICGSLDKGDLSFYPKQLHGPRFFNSPNGRIKVTFRNHFSYGNELVAQNDPTENGVLLTVQIAFTAYSKNAECAASPGEKVPQKNPHNFQCGLDKCIDPSLVCDGIVNCSPGENTGIGLDEANCTRSDIGHLNNDSEQERLQRKHRINRLHHTGHHHHHVRGQNYTGKVRSTTEAELDAYFDSDVVNIDEEEGGGVGVGIPGSSTNSNSDPNSTTAKPPQMTTIIVLVICLTLVTICGYFWSWLSQICCFFRSFRNFPRSGDRIGPSLSQSGTAQATLPRNIGIAYYVPAIILNNNNNNNNNNGGDVGGSAHNNNNSGDSNSQSGDNSQINSKALENPPAYETLFPQKE